MRWRHLRLLYMDRLQEERVDAVEPAAGRCVLDRSKRCFRAENTQEHGFAGCRCDRVSLRAHTTRFVCASI